MKYIALTLVAFLIGCSSAAIEMDQRLNEMGITRPESKNFIKAVVALDAACKQPDSTSIQACQFFNQQWRSLLDTDRFLKTSLLNPDLLTGTDRSVFDNVTLIGAAYREYIEAKQANADSQRLWNSFAAGAAAGTLFSRPTPPPQANCQVLNAHTPSPIVQCQ
jgi:hypothetical protein